jgi:hypothetical protein
MTKSPATAAPCGLIQLGEVTCGAVAVLLGCAFGEVTVGATDPCPSVRAACARVRTGIRQCGKGTVASWPARSAGGERE